MTRYDTPMMTTQPNGNTATTLVEACGVALGYGGTDVLSDVSVVMRAGEFWLLLGANGSGKTTFLRAVLGQLRARRGELRLAPELADRSRIGFVPQRCDLNPTLPTTVREFVELGLVGLRVPRAERRERLREALRDVALERHERAGYWSLSGGQRQRALVARALVRRPSFVILDEPTVGLDVTGRSTLLDSLAELNRRQGLTILFVTHDLASTAPLATHAALCCDGRMTAGPASATLSSQELSRVFGVPIVVRRDQRGTASVRLGEEGGVT